THVTAKFGRQLQVEADAFLMVRRRLLARVLPCRDHRQFWWCATRIVNPAAFQLFEVEDRAKVFRDVALLSFPNASWGADAVNQIDQTVSCVVLDDRGEVGTFSFTECHWSCSYRLTRSFAARRTNDADGMHHGESTGERARGHAPRGSRGDAHFQGRQAVAT